MKTASIFLSLLVLTAGVANGETFDISGNDGTTITADVLNTFDEPWSMTLLPDGRMLVAEKGGDVFLVSAAGETLGLIAGVPTVEPRGQGGFGDIILHPDFAENQRVYMSYVERDGGLSGAVVESATLTLTDTGGALSNIQRIWTQTPKGSTSRHYGHRLLFDTEGYLFITSGDRGEREPAQDKASSLGKIIRLNDDGIVPDDNPFAEQGEVQSQIWSLGHRNPLGIALDAQGNIWAHEMGPRHGDELNKIVRGENYGWPLVSDGRHYSGRRIPDHDTTDLYRAPAISWVPSIAPAGLVIYRGLAFTGWQGDALIGGLAGRAIVRVSLNGESGTEAARYEWNERVREIEERPDGLLYVLEDGSDGRLLLLSPKTPN